MAVNVLHPHIYLRARLQRPTHHSDEILIGRVIEAQCVIIYDGDTAWFRFEHNSKTVEYECRLTGYDSMDVDVSDTASREKWKVQVGEQLLDSMIQRHQVKICIVAIDNAPPSRHALVKKSWSLRGVGDALRGIRSSLVRYKR